MMERSTIPLAEDVLFLIIAWLDIGDILRLRQVCKALQQITYHRSIWSVRYARMVREREMMRPERDSRLSSTQMETLIRKCSLVDRHWRQASPAMETLRVVDISAGNPMPNAIYLAPGGRWLLLVKSTAVDIVDLEDSSSPPKPFFRIQDAGVPSEILEYSNFDPSGSRDGDSIVFFARITTSPSSGMRTVFAFWSATFHEPDPVPRFLGRVSLPDKCRQPRMQGDLFMFIRQSIKYLVIFDWKLALEGSTSFRYFCLLYLSPQNPFYELLDYCLLENSHILAMDLAPMWIQIFAPPEFQLVDSLDQPLPTQPIPPLWELWPESEISGDVRFLSLQRRHLDTESEWPVGALIVTGNGTWHTVVAKAEAGDFTRIGHMRGGRLSKLFRFGCRVMVTTQFPGGWYVDCYSVNDEFPTQLDSLHAHGTVLLKSKEMDLPHHALFADRPFVPIAAFEEDCGRMCFLMPGRPAYSDSATICIAVLDLV